MTTHWYTVHSFPVNRVEPSRTKSSESKFLSVLYDTRDLRDYFYTGNKHLEVTEVEYNM